MPRNIISENGGEPFAVHTHIILKNFWEYYIEEADKDGRAFGFVMGTENEWGDVYLPEIMPYALSATKNLTEVMPPAGYVWEK